MFILMPHIIHTTHINKANVYTEFRRVRVLTFYFVTWYVTSEYVLLKQTHESFFTGAQFSIFIYMGYLLSYSHFLVFHSWCPRHQAHNISRDKKLSFLVFSCIPILRSIADIFAFSHPLSLDFRVFVRSFKNVEFPQGVTAAYSSGKNS